MTEAMSVDGPQTRDYEDLLAENAELRRKLRDAQYRLLTLRDNVIGSEAMVGSAQHEHDLMAAELIAVRASERWRVGGIVLAPTRPVVSVIRPAALRVRARLWPTLGRVRRRVRPLVQRVRTRLGSN